MKSCDLENDVEGRYSGTHIFVDVHPELFDNIQRFWLISQTNSRQIVQVNEFFMLYLCVLIGFNWIKTKGCTSLYGSDIRL